MSSAVGRFFGLLNQCGRRLLLPQTAQCEHSAGIKSLLFLKLRCRFCYFVRRNGRWMVDCNKYGHHRAVQRNFNTDLYW